MSSVWLIVAVLLAQAAPQKAPKPEVRTKVLPGGGYIRYEVLPGDDEKPAGELTVVHEERTPPPQAGQEPAPAPEPPPEAEEQGRRAAPPSMQKPREDRCAPLRVKLLARIYLVRGLDLDPEVAAFVERNSKLGSEGIARIRIGGESLLATAVRNDFIARSMVQELARCERER